MGTIQTAYQGDIVMNILQNAFFAITDQCDLETLALFAVGTIQTSYQGDIVMSILQRDGFPLRV